MVVPFVPCVGGDLIEQDFGSCCFAIGEKLAAAQDEGSIRLGLGSSIQQVDGVLAVCYYNKLCTFGERLEIFKPDEGFGYT